MSRTAELHGKVALITGAASGIGKSTALLLSEAGASVAVADIAEAGARQVANEIVATGGRAAAYRLDVTREEDWEACIAHVLQAWGKLDILVNNAGVAASGGLEDLTLADWRRVMSINLDGVFLGTRCAMRHMKRSGGGSIVNVASAAGIKALPNNGAYGTSKAAVRFLTKVAALEGAAHKIRVNSVSPGGVATSMWEGTPLWPAEIAAKEGREQAVAALAANGFAEARDIARTIVFLAGDEARFINGADVAVDSGFSAG